MNKKNIIFLVIIIAQCFIFMDSTYSKENKDQSNNKPMVIKLPEPRYTSSTSVEESLLKRRSVRTYRDKPLKIEEVSQLLWAAQGITDRRGFRTAPSAGALYPLEIYVVIGNVINISDGIYKYNPYKHELEYIQKGDKRNELCKAALSQSPIREAPIVIVFAAVYERTTVKYGNRGVPYVYIEVGHSAQNILLQAESLDLGTVVIGAFYDDEVKKVLKMSDKENPIYIIAVGRK